MDRREFIRIISMASGAGLISSCITKTGSEKIIPYLVPPDDGVIPGNPVYHKTSCSECPAGCGIEAKIYEKQTGSEYKRYPVKLEGIKSHPVNNQGALCIRGQASLERLYNPDRLKQPLLKESKNNFKKITYEEAFKLITEKIKTTKRQNIFLGDHSTGSLSNIRELFCKKLDIKRNKELEIYSYPSLRKAYNKVFNQNIIPGYEIKNSDFLLTLGADILETFISPVNYTDQLSYARENNDILWYHLEPHISLTGLNSDKRITIKPYSELYLLIFLTHKIISEKHLDNNIKQNILSLLPEIDIKTAAEKTGIKLETLNDIALKLLNAKKPLIITGGVSLMSSKGFETAVITVLLQYLSGMINTNIDFTKSYNYSNCGSINDILKLSQTLEKKNTGVIFISHTDIEKYMPDLLKIKNSELSVIFSETLNDTSEKADIILPISNNFEVWGYTEPVKGVKTLQQPVCDKFYDTLSEGDILLNILKKYYGKTDYQDYKDYVFKTYEKSFSKEEFKNMLSHGFTLKKTSPEKITLDMESVSGFLKKMKLENTISAPILISAPSVRYYDGRSKEIVLLNEIPDPLTSISYGEWISVSRSFADDLNLNDNDEIEVSNKIFRLRLPIKIQPGLNKNIFLIYNKFSYNNYDKRTGEINCYFENSKIIKTGSNIKQPILSGSFSQKGRGIIPEPVTKKHFEKRRDKSFYPEHKHNKYLWAMAIDLKLCSGCSSCVAACYIENNIPIAGQKEHLQGREMSWIRIEQYYEKSNIYFVPMMCQQCEYAPCEPVCPVYATYHNPEGLNAQVYNRCVGTRYCSNNCPYKVRRFNWFKHELKFPQEKMLNPELWARPKGVMEKCTFCIQRIRRAHDIAKDNNRDIKENELIPACAETCPSNAIVFGNILDKDSKVYKLAHSSGSYRIFENLGTESSIFYLKKNLDV